MKRLQLFIQCFVSVTTGIVIISAFSYRSAPDALTPTTLWQILLSAALCALSTALLFPSENAGKLRVWVCIGLHFTSLCAIMILCGRWFAWIDPTVKGAATMVLDVILVYAFTTGITYLLQKQQADAMNRKLKEKYPQNAPEE